MLETIVHRLQENGRVLPEAPAYSEKVDGRWVVTSWKGYSQLVRQAAKALIALGLEPGQTTTILGFNRSEWTIFDLATMMVGAAPAGIYTTDSPQQCAYIIDHAGSPIILVEDEVQWEKIREVRAGLPALKHIIMMQGAEIDDEMTLSWDAFLATGKDVADEAVDGRMAGLQMDQLATLIYTSGTTGPPKGVMLSHRNLAVTARYASELLHITTTDSVVSYLPLSHIAEQMFTIHGSITAGYQVFFAQFPPQDHLNDNLKETSPTLFFGVPRIWERFHAAVEGQLALATGARASIAAWARSVGTQVAAQKNAGKPVDGMLKLKYRLADRLLFSKVKAALGMSRMQNALSGAAPISREILEFFASLDIIILEIYGQSEGSGPSTINRPGATKLGTVGQVWPGSKLKLAEDDEILVSGSNVFLGYYGDEAATKKDLVDGWLHSGDLGRLDEEGYLSIIGRKKEIMITSGGKNISPNNIEAALKDLDLVSNAVVIGDGRRFVTALLTLDAEKAAAFAQTNKIMGGPMHDNPQLLELLQREIDAKVNNLFARVEQVRGFRVLPRDFTIEDGELTPTLKLKRRIIYRNFSEEIESMYQE